MGSYSGTIPAILSGGMPPATDWAEIISALTALTGAWGAWTPTLTNLTQGTGTVTARYRRLGATVDYRLKFVYASGSAVATSPRFTLPVAPHAGYAAAADPLGRGTLGDTATNNYVAEVRLVSGSTVEIVSIGASGVHTAITSAAPFTWGNTDTISVYGCYEAA